MINKIRTGFYVIYGYLLCDRCGDHPRLPSDVLDLCKGDVYPTIATPVFCNLGPQHRQSFSKTPGKVLDPRQPK